MLGSLELVDFIWAAARPQLACYLMLFCVNIVPATAQPTSKKSWCSLERWINFIVTLYVTHSRLSETQKLDIKLIKTCSNSRTRRQIFSFESFCIRWHLFLLQPAKFIFKSRIAEPSDYFNFYLAALLETRNIINYLLHYKLILGKKVRDELLPETLSLVFRSVFSSDAGNKSCEWCRDESRAVHRTGFGKILWQSSIVLYSYQTPCDHKQ